MCEVWYIRILGVVFQSSSPVQYSALNRSCNAMSNVKPEVNTSHIR